MTENTIMEDEQYMFRTEGVTPPRMTPRAYMDKYLQTREESDFQGFLYYYENLLNKKIWAYVKNYGLREHFVDLKMVYVEGIVKALEVYNTSFGVPFLEFKEYYCLNELHEYSRVMLHGYTVPSSHEYRQLRNIMRIYNENDRKQDPASISMIADKLGISENLVKDVLMGGLRNERSELLYFRYKDSSGNEITEDVTVDNEFNPERAVVLGFRGRDVMKAYESLRPKDRNVLASRLGFCEKCYSPKEKLTFEEIRIVQGYASINAVEQKYVSALRKLAEKLTSMKYLEEDQKEYEEDDNWISGNSA